MADIKAISTYKTYLHYKSGDSYEKLIDIKDFPDLGGEPEMLETTTLSDKMQTYIPGIQSLDALTFTCNYTKEEYAKLCQQTNIYGDGHASQRIADILEQFLNSSRQTENYQ